VAVAAQAHIALKIDIYRRDIVERIGDRAACRLKVLADVVASPIDGGLKAVSPPYDRDRRWIGRGRGGLCAGRMGESAR
jgi:hypothetical protein